MYKFIISLTIILFSSIDNYAQISLLGEASYGHYLDESVPGIKLNIGIEKRFNSILDFRIEVGTYLSESKGKFTSIPSWNAITLGESSIRSIFGFYTDDLFDGLHQLPTRPNKFTSYSFSISSGYNYIIQTNHSIRTSLGFGISYVTIQKIAHVFEPTSFISPFAGELITPHKPPISFIVFLYQRYLDVPLNISLEYFYEMNKNIDLGLRLNYTRLLYSGNSVVSFGGIIRI